MKTAEGWQAFFDALPAAQRGAAQAPGVDETVQQLLRSGRSAHRLSLAEVDFARALAASLARARDLGDALSRVRAPELYLTAACASGDLHAVQLLEKRFFGEVRAALGRVRGIDEDEVLQQLRQKLFVGTPPRIGSFEGRGSLGGWLCAAAVRVALNSTRRNRSDVQLEEADELADATTHSPELGLVKQRFGPQFRAAFNAALKQLPREDRTLLRFSYLDGLSIDALAGLLKVHRSTAARRLVKARELVLEATQQELARTHGLSTAEVNSLLRTVMSSLDVSMRGLMSEG